MQQITRILDITVEYARYTPTKFWRRTLSQTAYSNYESAVYASGSCTSLLFDFGVPLELRI
jgi:hypothetical protein